MPLSSISMEMFPGQAEVKSFPSHLKSETVIAPTDTVWGLIGDHLQLNHKEQSPDVKIELHKILAEKGKFESILQSAGPYIYFIYQETQQRHLPAEIALIPIIESEFNPNDHSKKGATGLWQIMPQTARELGIIVKAGYDGRRNVVHSTHAALAYFKDLGDLFKGNWYLAIAAYDAGQGKIISAVRHAGSTNYHDLKLARETKEYVPKLLAVSEIIKDPKKYGVQLPSLTNHPYFSEFKMNAPVSLNTISQISGVDLQTLKILNPDYKGNLPSKGPYVLLVPEGHAALVKKQLAKKIISS